MIERVEQRRWITQRFDERLSSKSSIQLKSRMVWGNTYFSGKMDVLVPPNICIYHRALRDCGRNGFASALKSDWKNPKFRAGRYISGPSAPACRSSLIIKVRSRTYVLPTLG